MKFKITRSAFLEAIKSVQNIVVGKGSLPILQNVLLDVKGKELTLTTTDLDISIRSVCDCELIEDGITTMPVKLLFNAVAKMAEGEVLFEVDAKEIATITSGNAKFKIAGLPGKDFPQLPQDENAYVYKLEQATLKEMFRKVAYAASQDDTRRTLKGVLMSFKDSKITMVATDGRRLAMVEANEIEISKTAERDIVLPSKAVAELQRSLNGDSEVSMLIQKSQICIKLDRLMIYSKLIDEKYPNYRQVIPQSSNEEINIDRLLLLNALDRVSVMTVDEAHSTKLIFENGSLTVTSAVSDIGEAKDIVPIKYAGEKIEIMFNPSYVMDCLKAIDDDDINIKLIDGHSPAVITCSIPFVYVLMPLRIN